MNRINEVYNNDNNPVKIIQFGEGNFLRAFVDYLVQKLNDDTDYCGSVVVVQPIENGLTKMIDEQKGCYTHILKGVENGEAKKDYLVNRVISKTIRPYEDFEEYLGLASIDEANVIISNTTEAGIVYDETDLYDVIPPKTFPGKLTRLLYERFIVTEKNMEKGYSIIPCELIDNNGAILKMCVLQYIELWNLGDEFKGWIQESCDFVSTLVDRIVPGFPRDTIDEVQKEIGYKDNLVVESERFLLWVIEDNQRVKRRLPLDLLEDNIIFADDIKPYKTRKVRVLNGMHTFMVPIGLCAGIETVKESVENPVLGKLITKVLDQEIIASLDMDKEALKSYGDNVIERFMNPYVKHALSSISLNSISKFKTRVLPSIINYYDKFGKVPQGLAFSFASLITFYRGELNEQVFELKDDAENIEYFRSLYLKANNELSSYQELTFKVLSNQELWGEDLTKIGSLQDDVAKYLFDIQNKEYSEIMEGVLNG